MFQVQVNRSFNGDSLIGTLPECGPRNINGRGKGNRAAWSVSSTLAAGSTVEVGTEWIVRAKVTGLTANNGNNGPDPLVLRIDVTGTATSVDIVGVTDPPGGEVIHGGDGFTARSVP